MRITNVDVFQLRVPLDQPFGWSQGRNSERRAGLVRITTDDGIEGWGEGSVGPAAAVVDEALAPVVRGQDPMQRVRLWQRMYHALYNDNVAEGYGGMALSAVDIALWDLVGKATGLPVAELLGGAA